MTTERILPLASPPPGADIPRLSELALLRSQTPASESAWQRIQDRIDELERS